MGATLVYAKVVDQESLQRSGGQLKPGTDNGVRLSEAPPAAAAPFYVLRQWKDFDAFTETWRIADPHGRTVVEPVTREVLAGQGDLADSVDEQVFEYGDEGFQLILEVDGREVARVDFPVSEADAGNAESA